MTKSDRANFGSKLGVILASAGSAVGLGNIWRFPFETGNHGGAAFIFVYLVCVLILGIPHHDCRIPHRQGARVPIRQGLIRNWHPARIGAG